MIASASFITTHHASALDDAALTVNAGAGGIACPTPSTLDELDAFLRKNFGSHFPETDFSAFCLPFKPEFSKLKKIDQLRAQNAAIDTLGQIVCLGFCSFDTEIALGKVPVFGFSDVIAYRPATMEHYHGFTHAHFLRFQTMITQLLEWAQNKTGGLAKDAKAALTQPYGSSDILNISWLRDRKGIVPMPQDKRLKKGIYSSPAPYGDWGDDFQRAMVFIDGNLITAPGVSISTQDSVAYKFVRENGLNGDFLTSPITMRIKGTHPIVLLLQDLNTFRPGTAPNHANAFLVLPATLLEDKEFETAFLEELIDALNEGDAPFEEALVSSYLAALDDETIHTATDIAPESPKIILEKYTDSLYEEHILAEQAEISRKVAEGSIEGKVKASRKSKTKHVTAPMPAKLTPVVEDTTEKEALRKEICARLKEKGRTKWRTLARVLISTLKNAHADKTIVINLTEKGSHLMLHIAGEKSSDGVTIIRPHGKSDRSISAGEARGLADKLIDLTFKLMTRPS